MALKGLLLCVHGMLFVLLPGYVTFLVLRRAPAVDRSLMWWGAGGMLVATLLQGFFTSLMNQILSASDAAFAFALTRALLMGICVQGMAWLILRRRRLPEAVLVAGGAAVGLGMGLVHQVFQGFVFLGVGLKLIQGDTSTPLAMEKAASPAFQIALAAVDSVLGRVAWLILSAGLGVLVANALKDRKAGWFIVAVLCHALIALIPPAIASALSVRPALAIGSELAFEVVLLAVGWRWLSGRLPQSASRDAHLSSGRRGA